jgi:hypothetical protein
LCPYPGTPNPGGQILQLHARSDPYYQEPLILAEIEGFSDLPADLAGPETQRRVVEAADPLVDPCVGEQAHGPEFSRVGREIVDTLPGRSLEGRTHGKRGTD